MPTPNACCPKCGSDHVVHKPWKNASNCDACGHEWSGRGIFDSLVWHAAPLEALPRPLAYTYLRLQQEVARKEPVAAAWALRDALECAVRFTACLGLADLVQAGTAGQEMPKAIAPLFKPTGLSLGDWASLLAAGCDEHLPPVRHRLLPGLATFYKRSGTFTPLGEALSGHVKHGQNLVSWRNKVFGHGVFSESRQWYAIQVQERLADLHCLYDALLPILDGWVLREDDPAMPPLMGAGQGHAAPAHEHVAVDAPRALLLRHPQGATLSFGPLLAAQRCTICGERHAFFFDKGNRRKGKLRTELLDYLRGHHCRQDDWAEALAWEEKLPEEFRWQRMTFDQDEVSEEGRARFHSFETEFVRPDWIMDQLWEAITTMPRGYVHLRGAAGVGKSYIAKALAQEGRNKRALPVLLYHIGAGLRSDYRVFISLLADEAREYLKMRTQEIQAKDQGVEGLRREFVDFLTIVMRDNSCSRLLLVLDGLDELPARGEGEFAITDFLVKPDKLPEGCVIALTGRPELRPGIEERVQELRGPQKTSLFRMFHIDPAARENQDLLEAYALARLPAPLRRQELAARIMDRAGGVFLYVFHYVRALESGAFQGGDDLPLAREFYPAYLERLRRQVGDALYEGVYRDLLLFLVAARAPLTLDQLRAWGLRGEHLRLALADIADFVREVRFRPWHERVDDNDTRPRYQIVHQDFVRFVQGDATLGPLLQETHGRMAAGIENRHAGAWDKLDAENEEHVYDACFVFEHEEQAPAGAIRDSRSLEARVLALSSVAGDLWSKQRHELAQRILPHCVRWLRQAVQQEGREELANDLARALNRHGSVLQDLGRLDEAETSQRENVAISRRLVEQEGRTELADGLANDLATALNNHGLVLQDLGRLDEAEACLSESVAIRRNLVQEGRRELANDLATTLSNHGEVLLALGRLEEAEACQGESVDISRYLVQQEGRGELAFVLATALNNHGEVLRALGRVEEAEACQRENVSIMRRLVEQEGRTDLANYMSLALNNHGSVLQDLGRLDEAEACQGENVAIMRRLVEQEGRTDLANYLATALNNHGSVLQALGRLDEAEASQRENVAISRRLVEQEGRTDLANYLATALNNHGSVLQDLGRLEEAAKAEEEASIWKDAFKLFSGASAQKHLSGSPSQSEEGDDADASHGGSSLADSMVRFAQCCNPLPGDKIVGYIETGRGVVIHTESCSVIESAHPERLVEVTWDIKKPENEDEEQLL